MFHKTASSCASSKILCRKPIVASTLTTSKRLLSVYTPSSKQHPLNDISTSFTPSFVQISSRFYSQEKDKSNIDKVEVEVEQVDQIEQNTTQVEGDVTSIDKQFSGGLSDAALREMEALKEQNDLQEEEAQSDYGYSNMTPEETREFLPHQNKDILIAIATYHGLPNISKRTPSHELRNILMHYKLHPEDPIFQNVKRVVIPPIIPKSAYKKKYWGHQWMYSPEEAKRWPTVKFILRDVRSSPKRMYITADFIKGMQLKEAVDQLILWRKKTNILAARFLWSCMKISEHNYSFVQDDILIKEAVVQKGLFLKRMRYHGKGKFGIMKRKRCSLVVTLCEVPRSNPNQKIGRFGWRPETWRKFEETYPEMIAQMEQRETLEREAAIRWREKVKNLTEEQQREERMKLVEEYQGYFKEESKFATFDLLEEPQTVKPDRV